MKFGETLHSAEEVYGRIWNEKPLVYDELKQRIFSSQEQFFSLVESEVTRVNKVFLKLAKVAVQEHEIQSRGDSLLAHLSRFVHGLSCALRPEDAKSAGVLAHVSVEYAVLNSIALRKILKKFDKCIASKSGSEFWKHLWSVQNRSVAFLHSPLLVKLKAIESIEALPNTSTSQNDDENDNAMVLRPQCRFITVDINCQICLDVLYKPVALSCGHVYCLSCLLEGYGLQNYVGSHRALLSNIPSMAACFQCRQRRVFRSAELIPELDHYCRLRNPEAWNERDLAEKQELARKLYLLKTGRNQECVHQKFHPSLLLNL
eukprot:g7216.t1